MSKVVKGVKKGVKKVGKFVKNHWKPIVTAGAVAFTAGLATPGFGFAGMQSAFANNGILGGLGSTMWAGAKGLAGSFGIGQGVGGSTVLNRFTGAQGASTFGGLLFGTGGSAAQNIPAGGWRPPGFVGDAVPSNPGGGGGGLLQGLGNVLGGGVGPALVGGLAQYFATRGQQEDEEPRALFGVDFENGNKAHQPWGSPSTATGTVPYSPVALANQQARRGPPPLLDPDNPAFINGGPYG